MRIRKLTKWLAGGGMLALVLSANPDTSLGQFPGGGGDGGFGKRGRGGDRGNFGGGQFPGGGGGFGGGGGGFGGGGGRGGFTADSAFDRMIQATGAQSGDVVDYSKLSPEYRQRTNGFLKMMNQPELPTSGTVTRDQYKQQFEQRMQAMQAARGGGAGGPPQVMMTTAPGMTPGQPSAFPPGGGGPGGWGGGMNGTMTDEQIQGMMRRYDTNGDGRISREEGMANPRLAPSFDQYDANRDGSIDTNEFKAYITARMADRMNGGGDNGRGRGSFPGGPGGPSNFPGMDPNQQWGGGGQGGWGGGGWDPQNRGNDPRNEEEKRPVVFRYGKLPKELPGWFTSLDEDKDGQIAMHEWRHDGRAMSEFVSMDLNGDGLVTAEEYLRYQRLKEEAASEDENGNPTGGRRSGSSADRGGSDRGGSDRWGGDRSRFGGGSQGKDRGGRGDTSKENDDSKSREDRRNRGGKGGGGNPFRSGN